MKREISNEQTTHTLLLLRPTHTHNHPIFAHAATTQGALMTEYTPSTMSIRDVWSFARATTGDGIDHEQARAEFDRWLAAHDADIWTAAQTEARDEGNETCSFVGGM